MSCTGDGEKRGGVHARRRRSVSSICVSTSLMPTPGPPLREREGMMRRWRVVPPGFDVGPAEGPACVGGSTGGDLEEGPAAEAAAADAATATPAGGAVDADARLGIRPRQRERDFRWICEREEEEWGSSGWAASPLFVVPPLPCYGACSASDSVVHNGRGSRTSFYFNFILFSRSFCR